MNNTTANASTIRTRSSPLDLFGPLTKAERATLIGTTVALVGVSLILASALVLSLPH